MTAAQQDNRVIYGMDIDDYHAHAAVSRSGLMLMEQSPQHYYYHYLSGLAPKIDTTALRVGGAFHTLILEPMTFNERVAVVPANAPKKPSITQLNAKKPSEDTIIAIDWWQQFDAYVNGRTVIDNAEFNKLQAMANALKGQPASNKVFVPGGHIEASYFWYDEQYGVHVKTRPDYNTPQIVLDLKSTIDASRDSFEKAIVNYGYDIQAFMQMEGVERVTGVRPQNFVFCCVEKEPPHAVAFYVASDDMLNCGKYRYHKLMDKFSRCLKSGVWPGYGELIQTISVPDWYLRKLEKETQ